MNQDDNECEELSVFENELCEEREKIIEEFINILLEEEFDKIKNNYNKI